MLYVHICIHSFTTLKMLQEDVLRHAAMHCNAICMIFTYFPYSISKSLERAGSESWVHREIGRRS